MSRTKKQNNGMCVFAAIIWPTSLCLTVVGNLLRTMIIIESMTSSEDTMTRFLKGWAESDKMTTACEVHVWDEVWSVKTCLEISFNQDMKNSRVRDSEKGMEYS